MQNGDRAEMGRVIVDKHLYRFTIIYISLSLQSLYPYHFKPTGFIPRSQSLHHIWYSQLDRYQI